MKTISCENGNLVFVDGYKRKVLLDISHYMKNKSRFPLQYMSDGKDDILGLIFDLKKKHTEMYAGRPDDFFSYYLLDIIAVSYLIRTATPLKVLEMGATNGILSYHLASLMGKLNPESLLFCVSNVIGNDSENDWLDRISQVEEPPDLASLVSDYDATQLAADHFDIVVLNGTAGIDKPYETVREAERLVKKNGILLCY